MTEAASEEEPSGVVVDDAEAPEPAPAPPPEQAANEAPEGGYVPMSEWIEDFDRPLSRGRRGPIFATILRLAGGCPRFLAQVTQA